MADTFLNFKYGTSEKISKDITPVNPGTIYITTDEKRMYVDLGTERYRIGDFETYKTFAELKADSKNWTSDTLVYIQENNTLAKYDKETNQWIQINDTSALQELLEGKIKEVADDVSALEGTVAGHTTEISDIKAALGIDSSVSGNESLTARVEATEKEIDDLQAEQTTQNEAISKAQTQADKGVSDAAAAQTTANSASAQANANMLNINTLTTTVTNNKADIEGKLNTAVTELKGASGDDSTAETIAGAKKYADEQIAEALQSADAMTFKGVLGVDENLNILPTDGVQAGDTYKVGVAGEYLGDGTKQYVGDLIIAKKDQPLADLEYTGGWYHISSGYEDDYDCYFKNENNTVKIIGGDGQANGSFSINAADGSGIKIETNASGTGDITSPSQTAFNIGFVWGTF